MAGTAAPTPVMKPSAVCVDNPYPQVWGPPATLATRSDNLVCCMVGLPARGKTFIARKLCQYISFFYGSPCKVFNVGEYLLRLVDGKFQPASFFDESNEEARALRRQASEHAVVDLCEWMSGQSPKKRKLSSHDLVEDKCSSYISGEFGAVAIYDATNSTKERRRWLVERLRDLGAKVIFLEVTCSDSERISENIQSTHKSLQVQQVLCAEEAGADFMKRIGFYNEVYETLSETEYSWIKFVDGGREISLHNMRGFLASRIAQFLLNLHGQRRPVFLSRHGQSEYNRLGKIGGDSVLTSHGEEYATALADWVDKEVKIDATGKPRPARLWTSSLKRTRLTARHIRHDSLTLPSGTQWVQMRPKMFRNLDEIYAGLCDGMTYEEIEREYPEEATARKGDKFEYRYPRGESYTDLISRLEPMAHEMERAQETLLVVAHQAILRVLYAYFMGMRREECPDVSIPLNTVIKLTPTAEGCSEERFTLLPNLKGKELDPASH